MRGWLFDKKPIAGHDGGNYVVNDAPWRLILHTTEGLSDIDGQVRHYARTGNYPHGTVDLKHGLVGQHVSFFKSVTTTKNKAGGVETNRLHAIQFELIGFAKDCAFWPDEWLQFLGEHVVGPVCRNAGIPLVGPPRPWVDARDGFIARPDAPQRLTFGEWNQFSGICGHQHVPENDHWDPGKLDLAAVIAAASPPVMEEPDPPRRIVRSDMEAIVIRVPGDSTRAARLYDGVGAPGCGGAVDALIAAGVKLVDCDAKTYDAFLTNAKRFDPPKD